MTTFTVITYLVCLVGLQINAYPYAQTGYGDLYAEATKTDPQLSASRSYGHSGSNYGSYYNNKGGLGGFGGYNSGGSNFGKYQSFGKGGKGLGYGSESSYGFGGHKVKIPAGYGSSGFGFGRTSSLGLKKGGFGSSILGSTQGANSGVSKGCACGSNQYSGDNVGSPNPYAEIDSVGAENPNAEIDNVGAGNPDAEIDNVGAGNPDAEIENVGSPYPGSFDHYDSHHHGHVIPGPSHTFSYPQHAPPAKCGHNLLISCNPSSQVVPCSAHSPPPSYGHPY